MKVFYYLVLIAFGLIVGVMLLFSSTDKPKEGGGVQDVPPNDNSNDKDGEGDMVRKIVSRAYWELSKRGVPWLWRLSCVARCGGSVSVALHALEDTKNELAGRYNVRAIDTAINELKSL